ALALGACIPLAAQAFTTTGPAPVTSSPASAPAMRSGTVGKIAANGAITIDGTEYRLAATGQVRNANLTDLKPGTKVQYTLVGNEITSISAVPPAHGK
ncbi:MAG: hypothetical protein RBS40_16680, partial [Rhodocyclaceae bacterium]|nr:hypothetical protein [Rhodocyclaceae bacterium]